MFLKKKDIEKEPIIGYVCFLERFVSEDQYAKEIYLIDNNSFSEFKKAAIDRSFVFVDLINGETRLIDCSHIIQLNIVKLNDKDELNQLMATKQSVNSVFSTKTTVYGLTEEMKNNKED